MNALKEYLDHKAMTVTDFSKASKIPVPTIWRYVNGKFKPSAPLALRIEQATNGAVSRMELLYPQKEAAK